MWKGANITKEVKLLLKKKRLEGEKSWIGTMEESKHCCGAREVWMKHNEL